MKPPPKESPLNLDTLASGTSVNYLNTDEVHWNGQPVGVVVADTLEAAQHAAELVHLTYETLPFTVDLAAEEPNAVPQRGNMLQHADGKKGDADAALVAAPVSVDLRFTTPRYHHNALEPHATTAIWDGDHLTVHDSTQNIAWSAPTSPTSSASRLPTSGSSPPLWAGRSAASRWSGRARS